MNEGFLLCLVNDAFLILKDHDGKPLVMHIVEAGGISRGGSGWSIEIQEHRRAPAEVVVGHRDGRTAVFTFEHVKRMGVVDFEFPHRLGERIFNIGLVVVVMLMALCIMWLKI